MTIGRFELRQDAETGRRYWFGGEDGWKDATEVGEDGTLIMSAEHFSVGTVLRFSEPDEGEPLTKDNLISSLMFWMVGWRDELDLRARKQMENLIAEYRK